ncbi:MAG: Uma2 family endonuclease [Cyclobacteriaceae bacterium]
METLAPPKITTEAYLEQERRSEEKHEYHDGTVISMSGASIPHNFIVSKLIRLLGNILEDEREEFSVFGSDLRVFIPSLTSYVYPDVVVIKGNPAVTDERRDIITNPLTIVEVLSESTEARDRGDKFEAYRTIESLREYVLVSQEKPHIEVFSRSSAQDVWKLTEASGLESNIQVPVLDLTLSLTDVYAKVNFDKKY